MNGFGVHVPGPVQLGASQNWPAAQSAFVKQAGVASASGEPESTTMESTAESGGTESVAVSPVTSGAPLSIASTTSPEESVVSDAGASTPLSTTELSRPESTTTLSRAPESIGALSDVEESSTFPEVSLLLPHPHANRTAEAKKMDLRMTATLTRPRAGVEPSMRSRCSHIDAEQSD